MKEQTVVAVAKQQSKSPPRGAGADPKSGRRFTVDDKLKAIRLHRQEGFSQSLVCKEMGISKSSLSAWLHAYRLGGEAGLQPAYARRRKPKLPGAITEKILELKRAHPAFGIKSISQILRRLFFLPASPETVRRRLHDLTQLFWAS